MPHSDANADEETRPYFAQLMRFVCSSSHADRAAFIFDEGTLTYQELYAEAQSWAKVMHLLGLRQGDRVAVMLEGCRELLIALVGNYLLGAIHVPVNTRYQSAELHHILDDAQPALAIVSVDSHGSELLSEWANRENRICVTIDAHKDLSEEHWLSPEQRQSDAAEQPWLRGPKDDEETALLIYTSGTTGRSKGVELPFRAVVANIDALTTAWRFSANDRLVLALPLFHVHGLCIGIHGTLLHGMSAVVQPRFEVSRVADAMAKGASVFMGVPTMYARLLTWLRDSPERAQEFRKARLFTSGSAALPAAHFRSFEALTGHKILERYGMSETLLTLSNPYEGERRPGSVGMAVEGSEVRIVNESGEDCPIDEIGEILVRGLSIMSGYRSLPEQTALAFREGWFLTGDVARMDSEGYVHIVGRQSIDIIKSGGYKISAREIEDLLRSHPLVADVAVVGLPDEAWGQRIVAAIVLHTGESPKEPAQQLEAHCRTHLADFKTPRNFKFLEALPANAMGKIQKHRLVRDW